MFNFLRKKRENVYEKWFLFILATVVVTIGIGNELMKGTSALDDVPANSAFDDMSFYMCVVDAYNDGKSEDDEKREYTDSLTDEELASITYLNCSSIGNGIDNVENIKSTKGIEKLVSLVELQLYDHDITSIDLSKNVLLENLYLNDNQLTEINVFDNNKLVTLNIKNNKLTNIDVSNNFYLQYLDVSENQLTSIDISNNVDLLGLYVNNNQLSELNLTNNNKLQFVVSLDNNFSKTLNLYKGDTIPLETVENVIKLPSELSQDLFSWLVWDIESTNIISLDKDGVVSALSGGTMDVYGGVDHDDITNMEEDISYFLINNTINVIDISSEEYTINHEENFIYTGNESLDVNKVDIIGFNLNVDSDNLQILNEEKDLITELDILSLNFGKLNVSNKVIKLVDKISYEDFISNVTKSERLSYKILNMNEEIVDTDNIVGGEKIEIYYNDIFLDSYDINIISQTINDIIFDDNIVLDEEKNYVKVKKQELSVSEFLTMVNVSTETRIFVSDVLGDEKSNDDLLVTGDTFTVFVGNEKLAEYLIAVRGDTNGDGRVSLTDLSQVRKHIVGAIDNKTGEMFKKEGIYLNAIDINNDGNISLSDLSKIRRIIVGDDIDG